MIFTTKHIEIHPLLLNLLPKLTCGGLLESEDHRDAWLLGLSSRMFLKNKSSLDFSRNNDDEDVSESLLAYLNEVCSKHHF